MKSALFPVLLFCNVNCSLLPIYLGLVATPHFENTLDGDPCFSRHFLVNERKCSLGIPANLVLVGFALVDSSPVHPCRGDFERAALLLRAMANGIRSSSVVLKVECSHSQKHKICFRRHPTPSHSGLYHLIPFILLTVPHHLRQSSFLRCWTLLLYDVFFLSVPHALENIQ